MEDTILLRKISVASSVKVLPLPSLVVIAFHSILALSIYRGSSSQCKATVASSCPNKWCFSHCATTCVLFRDKEYYAV
ncbi:Uncharacterized protein HZ326_29456 [Fusarium oxysporum f. sp. albedinis]|nr:Uncharacterized protein HZ326_29456 [Fusarium oxysporum f. sp. albedinis]